MRYFMLVLLIGLISGSVSEIDGNIFETVQRGNIEWT